MKTGKKIALFGGSFNPPAIHHQEIAKALGKEFDQVIILPCGPRPDKPSTNSIDPRHKAVMVDMAFEGIPKTRVELFDLENNTFTRNHTLQEKYGFEGELWHVVGADIIQNGGKGESVIHQVWEKGRYLWNKLNFIIVARDGYTVNPEDLPPHHKVLFLSDKKTGSSSEIRALLYNDKSVGHLLDKRVYQYISRYSLYGSISQKGNPHFVVPEGLKVLFVLDKKNNKAVAFRERFKHLIDEDNPDLIVVLGGDGTMLRAIRNYWRYRVPFYGINFGNRGFLLNAKHTDSLWILPDEDLFVHRLPMLFVLICDINNDFHHELAFNDAWLEREGGQTAWIKIDVNGETKMSPRLIADGVLVATAQGSTAYAMSMGATPLPVDTEKIIMVGNNVCYPPRWKQAVLSLDDSIEFSVLEPEKRPVRAYVDSASLGLVHRMKIRASRIAQVEIVYTCHYDLATKLSRLQFPK